MKMKAKKKKGEENEMKKSGINRLRKQCHQWRSEAGESDNLPSGEMASKAKRNNIAMKPKASAAE